MRHTLCFVAVIAAWAVTTAFAADQDYVDQTDQYRVTVPSGWRAGKPDGIPASINLVLASPRTDVTGGLCVIGSSPLEDTAGVAQAVLNEEMAAAVDEAFWRGLVEDKDVKDVTVLETRSEIKNGRRGYFAKAKLTSVVDGKDHPEQNSYALYLVPGRMYLVQCVVNADAVSVEENDIKTIVSSFEPTGSGLTSKLTPSRGAHAEPASLVLNAGPYFNGARFELMQDTPNLPQAGWGGATASLKLRGYGLWQICDGANYRGNCRIVAGAESAALGDRAIRIGSARRVVDVNDPRNALGVVADRIAGILKFNRNNRRHH